MGAKKFKKAPAEQVETISASRVKINFCFKVHRNDSPNFPKEIGKTSGKKKKTIMFATITRTYVHIHVFLGMNRQAVEM
jgi:predicted GTPase